MPAWRFIPNSRYNGLRQWPDVRGVLMDTCLTAQDNFKSLVDYFRITYAD